MGNKLSPEQMSEMRQIAFGFSCQSSLLEANFGVALHSLLDEVEEYRGEYYFDLLEEVELTTVQAIRDQLRRIVRYLRESGG